MNKQRILIGVAVVGLLWGAQARAAVGVPADGWGAQDQTEKFSKTVPFPKGGAFDLSNISGNIVITGGAGDQVVIDAVKRGKTAEDLKAVQIEVTTTANRVEVRTRYPQERRNINTSVDYTVSLPRGAGVNARSVSGDMKVSNVDGALRVETVSGNVAVTSAAQLEGAKTVSGDVTVETAGSAGDMSAASVSGSVKLRAVKAKGIDTNSVSGDVSLTDVTCDRAKANSISGAITFDGPLAKGGRYMLQSHSGDVTVRLVGASGFELNASTFSGDITSAVELTAKVGGESGRQGRPHGESMRGVYGDGGAILELSSFSGDIRIVKK